MPHDATSVADSVAPTLYGTRRVQDSRDADEVSDYAWRQELNLSRARDMSAASVRQTDNSPEGRKLES